MTVTQTKDIFVTGPVTLEGFQAVLEPTKFGYCLSTIVGEDIIEALTESREECLRWCLSKVKNPKRSTLKPEPWEEVSAGQYKVKFTWNDERKPSIRDAENTEITDTNLSIRAGSVVRLAFKQRPYVLKDGDTYGTSLKLSAVQIIKLNSGAGYDSGELTTEDINNLFQPTKGFSVNDPNVVIPVSTADDDF